MNKIIEKKGVGYIDFSGRYEKKSLGALSGTLYVRAEKKRSSFEKVSSREGGVGVTNLIF